MKVRVTAPAERGQANAAVQRLLSTALGIPKASVQIVGGLTQARKIVELSGLSDAEIQDRLRKSS